jgi:hypothetical protein
VARAAPIFCCMKRARNHTADGGSTGSSRGGGEVLKNYGY